MDLSLNDIAIILGINLLEQDKIISLTYIDIKKCYLKTIKLYHPDTNFVEETKELNTSFSKIINEAYEQALSKISDLRKISSAGKGNSLFNYQNYSSLFFEIIKDFYEKGIDFLFVLRSLRAIDNGMIIPSFTGKIKEVYGSDFQTLFYTALEASEANNPSLLDTCVTLMKSHLLYLKEFKVKTQHVLEYQKYNKR